MNTIRDTEHLLDRKTRRNVLGWMRRHFPGEHIWAQTGKAFGMDPATKTFNGVTYTVLHIHHDDGSEEVYSVK